MLRARLIGNVLIGSLVERQGKTRPPVNARATRANAPTSTKHPRGLRVHQTDSGLSGPPPPHPHTSTPVSTPRPPTPHPHILPRIHTPPKQLSPHLTPPPNCHPLGDLSLSLSRASREVSLSTFQYQEMGSASATQLHSSPAKLSRPKPEYGKRRCYHLSMDKIHFAPL